MARRARAGLPPLRVGHPHWRWRARPVAVRGWSGAECPWGPRAALSDMARVSVASATVWPLGVHNDGGSESAAARLLIRQVDRRIELHTAAAPECDRACCAKSAWSLSTSANAAWVMPTHATPHGRRRHTAAHFEGRGLSGEGTFSGSLRRHTAAVDAHDDGGFSWQGRCTWVWGCS